MLKFYFFWLYIKYHAHYFFLKELREKRALEEEERWREEEEQRKADRDQYESELVALQEKAVRKSITSCHDDMSIYQFESIPSKRNK